MRNKVVPARALYRLVSQGQQQQQQSAASSAAASASASSSSTSTSYSSSGRLSSSRISSSIASNARLSRAATVAARRRQEASLSASGSTSTGGSTISTSGSSSSSSSSFSRRRRSSTSNSQQKKRDYDVPMIVVNPTVQHLWSQLSSASTSGIQKSPFGFEPVQPPQTSLNNVALQNFFADQRPLLEHQVASPSSADGIAKLFDQEGKEEGEKLKSISAALMQSLQESGHLSESNLEGATVVIAAAPDMQTAYPQRIENIEQERFASLLDRLANAKSGSNAGEIVRKEAKELESEQNRRKDVEEAVNSALERGENPATAKALGSEADLVILGEPEGPNPSWARGTATHLAQSTRAFEPPLQPAFGKAGKDAVANKGEELKLESKEMSANIKIIDEREDDPNLLLSHAMVQATLPSALSWNRLVAKMDAATLKEGGSLSFIDVDSLDAELLPITEKSISEHQVVEMDSTKRKRKKKMRKHKYRKLRKATRIERSRLKK
jgi:Mitochondrial domain of unknown function (DUF1713)